MKKILGLALAVIMMAACFAGCGTKNEDGGNAAGDGNSAGKEKLVMATNAEFPPYEYHEGGEIVGIDAEVAALIAEELGMELEIVDVDFDTIVPGVSSGRYDIGMAGMTVTEERLESVNFTSSYATGIQSIIVTEDSPITSVDDLFGDGNYTIGVQTSTTGDIYSTEDIEDAGLGTVNRYNKGADAVQALLAGRIDCVIIDNEPAKAFVEANEGLKILDTEYAVEDYAICYAKDNEELGAKVNEALEKLIADGKVQEVIDKYINAD